MPTSTSLSNNVLVKKDKIQAIPLLCSVFNGSLLFVQTIHFFPVEKGLRRQKGPINSKKWVFIIWLFLAVLTNSEYLNLEVMLQLARVSAALLSPDSGSWWLVAGAGLRCQRNK